MAIGPLLALVGTVVLVACAGARGTPQSLASCRGNGGGGITEGDHQLIYAISHDSAGPQLNAAVVVHAPPSWSRRPPPDSQPQQWRPRGTPPRAINGATAGPMWIGHEGPAGMVWLDSVPVPLHDDNVLLLEVGADDEPRIVGRARVESGLPLSAASCSPPRTREEIATYQQALWRTVRRASLVREFLDR